MLLVEDDPVSAKSLKLLLANRGFDVTIASTVADAFRLLAIRPTHLILDLMLPDGDGAALLEAVREQNLTIWVAVTTGVNDPVRLRTIRALRPSLMLSKPIDLNQLLTALQ